MENKKYTIQYIVLATVHMNFVELQTLLNWNERNVLPLITCEGKNQNDSLNGLMWCQETNFWSYNSIIHNFILRNVSKVINLMHY